jgi:hypothetical protein
LSRSGHPIMKSLTEKRNTQREARLGVAVYWLYPLTLLVHDLPQALAWYCCLFLTAWVLSLSKTLMMMMIEVVCETLTLLNNLMWQWAIEDFIAVYFCKSLMKYSNNKFTSRTVTILQSTT